MSTRVESASAGRSRPSHLLRLLGNPLAVVVTAVASLLLSVRSTGLRLTELGQPTLNGDRFVYYGLTRSLQDQGWSLRNESLGYPYDQDLRRFPILDQTHLLLLKLLGLGGHDPILVTNLYYLLGFPLAGLAGYLFLRVVGVRPWLAVPLAVSYAILPWHTQRASHLFLASYWVVPLGLTLVYLVASGRWDSWLATLAPRRRRLLTVVGCLTGVAVALGGIYYALMLSALVLVALLLRGWRSRAWRGPSMWLVGTLAGTTATSLVVAALAERAATTADDSGSGFQRSISDGERNSGRIMHLLLPGGDSPFGGSARRTYDANTPLFLPEGTTFGVVTAAGTWLLLALAVAVLLSALRQRVDGAARAPVATRHGEALVWLAGLTVLLLLAYTTTGLGAVVSLITPEIRGWGRFSIFIAATSTAAVGLALQEVLARVRWQPVLVTGAVVALVSGVVVVDQVRVYGTLLPDEMSKRLDASRAAITQVDRVVSPRTCPVAHWPYRPFPEAPNQPPLRNYDEMITYLAGWDRPLSYGAVKGSIAGDWQGLLDQSSAEHLASQWAAVGYCVLEVLEQVVVRPQQKELRADLQALLGAPVATDPVNARAYYDLRPVRARLDALGPEAVAALREGALRPVQVTLDEETSRLGGVVGSGSASTLTRSTLRVTNSSDERRQVRVRLTVSLTVPDDVTGRATVLGQRVRVSSRQAADVDLVLDLAGHETRRFPIGDARADAGGPPLALRVREPVVAYPRGPFLEPPLAVGSAGG